MDELPLRAPFERVSATVGLPFPGNGILRRRDSGVEKARHVQLFLIGIGVAIWYWGFGTLWYAAEYWVPPDAVHIVARPTDCDFWRSPMGEKGCHYERAVRVYLSNHDIYDAQTGRVSDFQTGVESKLDPKAQFNSVLVLWTKKTDE